MGWTEALATYFIIWWLTLLMVLPWGVTRVNPDDLMPGEDHGSPQMPRLLIKFVVNTALAGVVFGIVYAVIVSDLISLRP